METLAFKIAVRIVLYPLAVYLVFSLIFFFMYTHPPRYESRLGPEDFNMPREEIRLETADGLKLSAWLVKNEKSRKAVILCHGYPMDKGNILPMTKFLAQEYNLLYFDFRAMGKSEGFFTTGGHKERLDIKAAADFLREMGIKDIALYGFSMGASAAIMAAEEIKARAVVAESPYDELGSVMDSIFRGLGVLRHPLLWLMNLESKIFLGQWFTEVSAARAMENLNIPVLLIHGERDSQIPFSSSVNLSGKNTKAVLWAIENADHGEASLFGGTEYEKNIMEFLSGNVKKDGHGYGETRGNSKRVEKKA